jgi:hypothetical protein
LQQNDYEDKLRRDREELRKRMLTVVSTKTEAGKTPSKARPLDSGSSGEREDKH